MSVASAKMRIDEVLKQAKKLSDGKLPKFAHLLMVLSSQGSTEPLFRELFSILTTTETDSSDFLNQWRSGLKSAVCFSGEAEAVRALLAKVTERGGSAEELLIEFCVAGEESLSTHSGPLFHSYQNLISFVGRNLGERIEDMILDRDTD